MKKWVTNSGLAVYESGSADKPTIILGHALGADSKIWDEVTKYLRDEWRVLRWDQPGHGESNLPEAPAEMLVLVAQLGDSLDELGVTQAHIGGLSLGGMVAMAAVAKEPDRFRSLAVMDAVPSLSPASDWIARAELVRAKGMSPLLDATMDRWFAPESRTDYRREGYERTRDTFLNCNPEGYAYCCEVIASTDLTDELNNLRLPTLVLTGENDPAMLPARAVDLAASIPGASNAVVIPAARHITSIHAPEAVAQAIASTARRSAA